MIRGSSREYNWQHIFCNRLSELLNNWKSLVYGYSLDSHWKWNEIVVVQCVTGRTRIVSNDTYSAAIVSLTATAQLYPSPSTLSLFGVLSFSIIFLLYTHRIRTRAQHQAYHSLHIFNCGRAAFIWYSDILLIESFGSLIRYFFSMFYINNFQRSIKLCLKGVWVK